MTEQSRQFDSIAALLRSQSTLALATTDENAAPCLAPLFYIVDPGMNLYWLSSPTSQHSRNLARNPAASAAVFRHTQIWNEICGVQMRGKVDLVDDPERRRTLVKTYCERFALSSIFRLAILRSSLYAFHPQWFRYSDNSVRFGYNFELTRPG